MPGDIPPAFSLPMTANYLFSSTTILFLAFGVGIWALIWDYRKSHYPPVELPTLLGWLIHGFILYGSVTVARIFYGYVGPSAFVSIWGAILILHGVLAIIGSVLLRQRLRHGRG